MIIPAFIRNKSRQTGMTFIEVLIALVIIVTGILGAVAMQATAKQASFDAMQRSLASSLAEDIAARMRAGATTSLASYVGSNYGEGGGKYAEPANRCSVSCTEAQIVANDQYEWELALMGGDVLKGSTNAGGLINAIGCISQVANTMRIVVSWQGRVSTSDAANDVCGVASSKRRQVIVQAFII